MNSVDTEVFLEYTSEQPHTLQPSTQSSLINHVSMDQSNRFTVSVLLVLYNSIYCGICVPSADSIINSVITTSPCRKAEKYRNKNIDFICETAENFNYSEKFDFIFLSGTLEHIINPDQVLTKISSLIKKNGTFVTDSPSEYNIRGTVHATLWKLFDFPATLSDVRIITPKYMNQLFKKYKFKQNNHIIGTLFSRGWGKALYADLSKRIPKIIEAVKKVKKIDVSDKMIMNYFEWLRDSEKYIPKLYENSCIRWKRFYRFSCSR